MEVEVVLVFGSGDAGLLMLRRELERENDDGSGDGVRRCIARGVRSSSLSSCIASIPPGRSGASLSCQPALRVGMSCLSGLLVRFGEERIGVGEGGPVLSARRDEGESGVGEECDRAIGGVAPVLLLR